VLLFLFVNTCEASESIDSKLQSISRDKWIYEVDKFDCSNMSAVVASILVKHGYKAKVVEGYVYDGEWKPHAMVYIYHEQYCQPIESTTLQGPRTWFSPTLIYEEVAENPEYSFPGYWKTFIENTCFTPLRK